MRSLWLARQGPAPSSLAPLPLAPSPSTGSMPSFWGLRCISIFQPPGWSACCFLTSPEQALSRGQGCWTPAGSELPVGGGWGHSRSPPPGPPSASCACPDSFEISVWFPLSHPPGFSCRPGMLTLENIHQCLEAALVLLTASG